MTQTTILESGTAGAISTDVVIPDGATRTVGIFSSGAIPERVALSIMLDTPGADLFVARLSGAVPALVLSGPGTFRVVRPLLTEAVGVFTEG